VENAQFYCRTLGRDRPFAPCPIDFSETRWWLLLRTVKSHSFVFCHLDSLKLPLVECWIVVALRLTSLVSQKGDILSMRRPNQEGGIEHENCEGYFEAGRVIPSAATQIPEHTRAIVTTLDETAPESQNGRAWRTFLTALDTCDEPAPDHFERLNLARAAWQPEIEKASGITPLVP
jgi:hypothetical protein